MRLRCIAGPLTGSVFELNPLHSYILGREPVAEDNSELIVLASRTVSRTHTRLEYDGETFKIVDLKSSNGIRVNRERVKEIKLRSGSLVQIGEFSFTIEGSGSDLKTGTETVLEDEVQPAAEIFQRSNSTPSRSGASALSSPIIKKLIEKLGSLDLRVKTLALSLIGGFLIHWIITAPFISETREALFRESFAVASQAVQSLGEKNKRDLADANYFLVSCNNLKTSDGILSAYLLDSQGKVVCPIGAEIGHDDLTDAALFKGEQKDDCFDRIVLGGQTKCSLVSPIREWKNADAKYITVGVARIDYSPLDAFQALQNLQTLGFKTLLLALALIFGIWWFSQRWIKGSLERATESVHMAVTGSVQSVEKIESFAGLDSLVEEVNRLISKQNQGLKVDSTNLSTEASFLHSILPQVLLLEERAVMVVDRDNHIIAASNYLSAVIPVDTSRMNIHITEAISDTHLQGELISLLNDLSQTNETIDRALSMADRVVQTRGMPLFLRDDYVASILIL